jgi:AGZA family xanthine/uracil permease-like MFS transporter|tara:strand:- start:36176 stop:37510 length:1335 start_codon:yes stop_codon:yes gene_type:complete
MLERLFKLSANGTTVRTELIAGLTTFAAMAYILAVNPSILSAAGMPPEALITVTALAAALGCFLMAYATNYPIALAPGMGTNAYFAFVICIGMGLPWQAALSLTFWNGIIFLILSVTGFRTKLAESLPNGVKVGIQTGIGFFIAFIGLKNAGIIINNEATLVGIGDLTSAPALLVFGGIILIVALTVRKFPAAILATVVALTVIGLLIPDGQGSTVTKFPSEGGLLGLIGLPPSMGETFFKLDILYPFTHFSVETISLLVTLLMLDLFDSLGTIIGLARRAKLLNAEGKMPKISRALAADAVATSIGAFFGTSTTTSYIESAAGVEAGGRTGLTSVTVGICFLLALFFAPLITMIPLVATTPALVAVGIFMAQGLPDLDFDDLPELASAVITMLLIPLTFSVTEGIGLGIASWIFIMILTGRGKEVPVFSYVIGGLFILFYIVR